MEISFCIWYKTMKKKGYLWLGTVQRVIKKKQTVVLGSFSTRPEMKWSHMYSCLSSYHSFTFILKTCSYRLTDSIDFIHFSLPVAPMHWPAEDEKRPFTLAGLEHVSSLPWVLLETLMGRWVRLVMFWTLETVSPLLFWRSKAKIKIKHPSGKRVFVITIVKFCFNES